MGNSAKGSDWGQGWGEYGEGELLVREVRAHSAEQHQQLVVQLSRFKQWRCAQVVQLLDSHALQASNLCSVVVHTYVLLRRPTHTLPTFLAKATPLSNKTLQKILADLVCGLVFLKQQGHEPDRLTEEDIFVQEEGSEVAAKLMNPFFRDEGYEAEEGRGAVADLGAILQKHLRFELHSQDLIQTVSRMASAALTLEELQHKYTNRSRAKLKVTGRNDTRPQDTARAQRESLASMASDGSSLLIQAGDTSDFALKEFYESLEGEVSEIGEVQCEEPMLTSDTLDDLSISHEFPKRYAHGRAFRKAPPSARTRDHSENGFELKPSLLYSAKLVHSFIADSQV